MEIRNIKVFWILFINLLKNIVFLFCYINDIIMLLVFLIFSMYGIYECC